MNIGAKLDAYHLRARNNKWLYYFAVFCRVTLAIGFIPPGIQKILGERFTTLAINHPMGSFLEAFHHTGYYYPFVGFMQLTAATLLLIPRTVTLGAFIYFPIILNICVLSLALRFDGSQVTSILMVCAVLFLICWDYHKFKNIFPFNHTSSKKMLPDRIGLSNIFPLRFFAFVSAVIIVAVFHTKIIYKIMPRNTISDCRAQCDGSNDESCVEFCDCIHTAGKSLGKCLETYNNSTNHSSSMNQ